MLQRLCRSKSISLTLLLVFLFSYGRMMAQDTGQLEKRMEEIRNSGASGVRTPSQPSRPSELIALEGVVDRNEYILGPGDEVDVSIWGGEEYKSYNLTVSAEGRLLVPPAGPIEVSGISLAAAELKVQQGLARYFTSGSSSLTLLKPRVFRVTVAGFVMVPGTYTVSAVDRVSDLLQAAGGVRRAGSIRRINLYDRQRQPLKKVDLASYLIDGDRDKNPQLIDGAIVEVPEAENTVVMIGVMPGLFARSDSIVTANREKELSPRNVVEFFEGETLGDVLQFTGYPEVSDGQFMALVRMSRPGDTGKETWQELGEDRENMVLEDGMVIEFYSAERMVYVNGLVNLPGKYPFYPGRTVGEYLGMAGGAARDADEDKVYLQKDNNKKVEVDLDTMVNPGDIIVLKQKTRYLEMALTYAFGIASTALVVLLNNNNN